MFCGLERIEVISKMKILFLCVANSARSQIAEGVARRMLGEGAEVFSAGSAPSGKVHDGAIAAMKEIGIDLSKHRSKSVDDLPSTFLKSVDFVISLCAEESCPAVLVTAKRLHWPIQDPAAASAVDRIEAFRRARAEIQSLLDSFVQEYRL